jgi:hypothetical protein
MIIANHFRISHIILQTRNVYEAAFRLRAETGLGFYDGGFLDTTATKIFPLGAGAYIQMTGSVDPFAALDPERAPAVKRAMENLKGGDRFSNLMLEPEGIEDMDEVAKARGEKVTDNRPGGNVPVGGRLQVNGLRVHTASITAMKPLPKGTPGLNYFYDKAGHPSGQPVEPFPGLVRPLGVAWIEMGASEAEVSKAIGFSVEHLPFRYNGKAPGIYSFAVKSEKGEIVVKRNSNADAV